MVKNPVNIESIASITYQGIGLGIVAGTAMRTFDMLDTKTYKQKKLKIIKL